MRRWLVWVAALMLGGPIMAKAADLSDTADLGAFVDGVMSSYLRSDKIPSAVVAIVRDGRAIFAKGYGQEDLSRPSPVDPQVSTFRVGSVSKLFTWTAVMQLVEQGKLDLDTDVNTYLKGWQLPRTYDAPVTLRSLMTHTAGFEEGSLFYLTQLDPKQQLPIGEALQRHMAARVRPPLMLPAYSNYGASLAGLIVEQVSGLPFNDYVRQNIFEPLRMQHTTFEEPLPAALQDHAVSGYVRRDGDFVKQPFEIIGGLRPAGSASSSAIDMTRFMLAHLQQGEYEGARILKPETVELMHSAAFRNDERLSGMALGFYEWSVNGLRVVGHAGDTDFFHTDLALIPATNFGLFISYVAGGDTQIRDGLLKALADRYFPAAPAQLPPIPAGFAEQAQKYVGAYQPSRRNITDLYKLFNLAMQIDVVADASGRLLIGSGERARQFSPVGENLFQEVGGDQRIAFRLGRDGRATNLFFDGEPYWGAERTPWYEAPGLFQVLILGCVLVFLIAPVVLRRRLRQAGDRSHRGPVAIAVGTAICALVTLFAIALVMVVTADESFYGVPLSIKLVLALPLIFAIATLALVGATAKVWSGGYWTRSRRILYTLNGAAAVLLCILFYQWNMFGWQFG